MDSGVAGLDDYFPESFHAYEGEFMGGVGFSGGAEVGIAGYYVAIFFVDVKEERLKTLINSGREVREV